MDEKAVPDKRRHTTRLQGNRTATLSESFFLAIPLVGLRAAKADPVIDEQSKAPVLGFLVKSKSKNHPGGRSARQSEPPLPKTSYLAPNGERSPSFLTYRCFSKCQ